MFGINYAVLSHLLLLQAGEEGPPGSLPEVGGSEGPSTTQKEEGRAAERW